MVTGNVPAIRNTRLTTHNRMIRNPALLGRLALWGAWTCPASLTVAHGGTPLQTAVNLAVAMGLGGIAAFLPRALWRIACAVTVLCLPFTIWWIGYAAVGGAGPGYDAAVAVVQTNQSEVSGALDIIRHNAPFATVTALHLLLLALACRCAWRHREAVTAAEKRFVVVGLAASLLPLGLALALADQLSEQQRHAVRLQPGNGPFNWARAERPHPLFGPATFASPLGSAEEIASMKLRLASRAEAQDYRRVAPPPMPQVKEPTLAIFFIGESARLAGIGPEHAARGVASRALNDRIARGLGAWLPPTCAAGDGTHLSVPSLLTMTPADQFPAALVKPTVMGLVHAAGYRTAWLADNHGGPDAQERGHDLYAGMFNVNPDDLYGDHLVSWRSDADMLPAARDFARDARGPRAILMHSIGSHFPYQARYPADFFAPEPEGLDAEALTDLRYDRSLEYTVHVVLGAASIVDASPAPAFLIYTSDHGENLPSDHDGLQGHLAARTSTGVAWVPTFVLWNQAMADTGRPQRILEALKKAPVIAHLDVSRAFLGLAGVAEGPVEPTPTPMTWGRAAIGDEYGPVACSRLAP